MDKPSVDRSQGRVTDHGEAQAFDTRMARLFADDFGSVMPPIYQSSLFVFDSYAAFENRMAGRSDDALYSRVQNPTVTAFEALLASAEGADAAIGFASGMAAISATIFSLVRPGDRIACIENVYPDVYRLLERIARPFGVPVDYHSIADLEARPELLDGVTLAYLESPNSIILEPLDLGRVAALARRHGTLTVVDNSWATPVFQRPLESGIDLVVHSASKYISGHSDTVAGVVAGRAELIDRIREDGLALFGGKLAPFEAWLLIRGMRTLAPRMRQHQHSADVFAERLSKRSEVIRVNAPTTDAVPGLSGRSGLMSVAFGDDVDIRALADAVRLFKLGVSWGGFESLILPVGVALAQAGNHNSLKRFEVPGNLVRISIGLEDVEDLWADFEAALDKSTV